MKISEGVSNILDEETLKMILNDYLVSDGWETQITWGHRHGTDILALKNDRKWVIEVKGCGSRNAMRVNYFLSILGEILQRMNDQTARYSIALPDLPQFRNLWRRFPDLAKERTQIDAIFINQDGIIHEEK